MLQGKIIQGTTPTLSFEVPIMPEVIHSIRISFSQRGKEILLKTESDCYFDREEATSIVVGLTQEDTYLFDEKFGPINIQLRVMSIGGGVAAADEVRLGIQNSTDKVVM